MPTQPTFAGFAQVAPESSLSLPLINSCFDPHKSLKFNSKVELETTLAYELHTTRSGDNHVLAFNSCSPDYTTRFLNGEFNLVSSEGLHDVDFIATKVNSSFSINEVAVELFQQLGDDLKELENKHTHALLIITGSGLGGYRAILSALRLHHAIDVEESNGSKNTKRPICITFGCPLVGDESLQHAIAECPQWKYSFLNVVANKDPVATFFSLDTPYKPFGTFLFCTESGGHTAFEDQDSILLVLDKFTHEGNMQIYDYMNVLSSLRRKVLYRGVSELSESNSNLLRAGITLQLKEVGMLNDITNEEVGEMEKQTKLNIRKKSPYEPTKKLNEMKISLTYMEWYMTGQKRKDSGYYDGYKYPKTREEIVGQQEILKHQGRLNQYWKDIVVEKDRMPQKEGAKLRKRWLLGGNNYRRIVEPLDIAEYYKKGNINYIETNRSDHYKLIEKWFNEDKKELQSSEVKRNKAASLTEDSCFWAHVEEALISLKDLVKRGTNNAEKKLEEFEAYVMREIENFSVSPDIFLDGTSFMRWWNEYKAHKGTAAYASEFGRYMNNGSYNLYK
ncbi:hypothetical protein M8C21_029407 [Ambrosia artemisiifolia]|uniref:Uncharacterized protein n=1 Tax=Ambrosia artemisiifolia TaxID=4212 RepID=A0AAD5G8W1_AMBAR|nr:hypothetical protein M8C21_029407 [Ambrosia artemisiifolia]